MATLVEVSREFTYRVAAKIDAGIDQIKQVSMAKNFACSTGDKVTYAAVQIFGGYGYMRGYLVERLYRDNRILSIGGGTTEIMKENNIEITLGRSCHVAQELADRRDVDFVLYEQLGLEAILENDKFSDLNKKTIDLIITEARNLAVKEILPTNAPGDQKGCRFENGVVSVPEEFHRIFELYREGEWIAMADDPQWAARACR